jgi:outer membrane protein TolC
MKLLHFSILAVILMFSKSIKAQIVFDNLDSLISYAAAKSTTLQSGEIKITQAKKAKIAAIVGVMDPTINASYSYIDNLKLPTSLFPSEALGGEPGTFQEVQTGVQYNSNFNNYNELKLINVPGWTNLKLAKLNIDLSSTENKISTKEMYENIASVYFNIINIKEQLKATGNNLLAADTLLQIAQNKYQQGLVKVQDVNESRASYLNTKESFNQLEFLLQQQYLSLKILTDIPENDSISITQVVGSNPITNISAIEFNALSINSGELNEKIALENFRQLKQANIPSLSFINNNSTQQYNTTARIYNGDGKWYSSTYIGLKLSIPIPSASSLSRTSNARYNYQLAQVNTEHLKNKTELEHRQLAIDYSKAISQWETNDEVYELKKDSYLKNLNLYSEGLMGLDQTLNSYNAMVSSNYNRISSSINVLLAESKININNKIK